MTIIESLRLFKEQNKEKCNKDDVIFKHLDTVCPQWKKDIKNSDCWKDVFEFIQQITYPPFAKALFNIIDNSDAEKMVFENDNIEGRWQLVAARNLLQKYPGEFLNQYIRAVKSHKFPKTFGYIERNGRFMDSLEEIFDFPGAVDVAIEMSKEELKTEIPTCCEYAIGYLAIVFADDNNWDRYPEDVKEYIVSKNSYYLRESCTQQVWYSLNVLHKFRLAHEIIINEYNYVRDVISLYEYLTTDEGCKLPIITPEIRMTLDDIRHHQDRFSNRDEAYMIDYIQHHISGRFYQPTVDYEQMRYNPSEQLLRFQQFAETSGDTIIAKELQSARREIEHSFLK